MSPFNIKIVYGSNEVTLTVLPTENDYYKIIYFGGILGAVCYDGQDWDLISKEHIDAGDLPFYQPGAIGERIEIELNDQVVDRIGWEIKLYEDEDL
jgi:hypothetical protein